ncbi:hypothetical protein [Corallococcus caeni]
MALLVVLGLTACTSRSKGPSPQARRDAMREWANQGSDYRSTEGFQDARWGMTSKEVNALFPEATPIGGGALLLKTTIARLPASVMLGFLDDRFVAVDVSFNGVDDVRERHALLRDLLTRKYGEPVRVRDTAEEALRRAGEYRTVTEVAVTLGQAGISASGWPEASPSKVQVEMRVEGPSEELLGAVRDAQRDFKVWNQWRTVESRVKLLGSKSPVSSSIFIEYESVRYSAEIARARELDRQRMMKDL